MSVTLEIHLCVRFYSSNASGACTHVIIFFLKNSRRALIQSVWMRCRTRTINHFQRANRLLKIFAFNFLRRLACLFNSAQAENACSPPTAFNAQKDAQGERVNCVCCMLVRIYVVVVVLFFLSFWHFAPSFHGELITKQTRHASYEDFLINVLFI